MRLEDLRTGTDVISSDDKKLGTLSRFVVHKDDLKLTHVVIDTGILRSGKPLWEGGWGLSHDRILPLACVADATSDAIRLSMSADDFRDHSVDYIEEAFEQVRDNHPGEVDLSDFERILKAIPGEPGPVFMYELKAKRPDEIEIAHDSPVWRLNPHQKIGEVERLIYDEDTNKVQDLVIRRGFLFTKEVLLPLRYVVEIVADIVRVDISDDDLQQLVEYDPPD